MKKLVTGKVREVYEVNDNQLVIVTTDRLSAFDVVLGSEIQNKGKALNKISNFWFDYTSDIVPNHIISKSLNDMPRNIANNPDYYTDRTLLVEKLNMLPYEFVVRGYIFGNMWKSYKSDGSFCGETISGQYQMAEKLEVPIITPSMKNSEGHDEYITMEQLVDELGEDEANRLCQLSLELYNRCYSYALERGIIIADTKFEFGLDQYGELKLGDEIFTPDSSRFWDASQYEVGKSPVSFDKQFVRDWLIENKLDGITPGPELPNDVVEATARIYRDCQQKILGPQAVQQ